MTPRANAAVPDVDVVVVGAGIIGIASALYLQRDGLSVAIVDPEEPGERCSYGNSGSFGVGIVAPASLPGTAWRIPRLLLDPRQPLFIDPALLHRYLASQLAERDGRFVIASNPFKEGLSRRLQLGYPDLQAALSNIDAERILLLYGSESPYRDSATQRRLMQALPNVRSAEIPDAGHVPRLLTPDEWNLLADFLLDP